MTRALTVARADREPRWRGRRPVPLVAWDAVARLAHQGRLVAAVRAGAGAATRATAGTASGSRSARRSGGSPPRRSWPGGRRRAPTARPWTGSRCARPTCRGRRRRCRAAERRGRPDGGPDAGPVRLPAGMFEWIDTGDPMPPGADTVVVRERLLPQADGSVVIAPGARTPRPPRATGRGRNVRTTGEDFAAGEILVPAGRRLRPGDLAAAAAGGHATVTVARRPVVAIIPTGDEIRPVGTVPRFGDIIDTNSLMLAARCRQLGAVPAGQRGGAGRPGRPGGELPGRGGKPTWYWSSPGQAGAAATTPAPCSPRSAASPSPASRCAPAIPRCSATRSGRRPAATRDTAGPGSRRSSGCPGTRWRRRSSSSCSRCRCSARSPGRPWRGTASCARLDRDWASPADVEDWVLVTLAPATPRRVPARHAGQARRQLDQPARPRRRLVADPGRPGRVHRQAPRSRSSRPRRRLTGSAGRHRKPHGRPADAGRPRGDT